MPTLNFKGKTFVQNHHLTVKFHELVPIEEQSLTDKVSLKDDNILIQGDNLAALKSLLPTYGGKIDVIYIDPPYNTGTKQGAWVYDDKVDSPMMREWLGSVVTDEDLAKHDKWLCMMMPRLKLLKELLSEDGVIFISIDYNEVHHLICLMNEIFGEHNYRDSIVIRRGAKSVQAQFETIDSLSSGYETVLVYSKNPNRRFNKVYEEIEYKPGSWNNHWRGTDRPTMRYKLFGIEINEGQWRWGEERSLQAIENYNNMIQELEDKGIEITDEAIDNWYLNYVEENGEDIDLLRLSDNGKPEHFVPPTDKKLLSNAWFDLKPNGSNQLKKLFGKKVFDNPKSIDLVKRLIKFATDDKNALILDSFAGSGTTGHAVLELNNEDDGNRKFILVEMEDYANEITAERIRRVIKGVPNSKDKKIRNGIGGSFSYFKLGKAIEIESILSGEGLPTYEELARYVYFTATGELFDDNKINRDTGYIGSTKDYEVYLFYEPDIEYLKTFALNLDVAKKLKQISNKRNLVFAPMKFLDQEFLDMYRIDFVQIPFQILRREDI